MSEPRPPDRSATHRTVTHPLFDHADSRRALTAAARDFHSRGWMAGTAGNLSARPAGDREEAPSLWITASGRAKGQLGERDLLRVSVADGAVLEAPDPALRPSAETAIHRAIYRLFPETGAVFHTHMMEACLAAGLAHEGAETLRLPALEMIKGFGRWEPEPRVNLPLFDNLADIGALAELIEARFARGAPDIPALLIHAHGVTVWGDSLERAYHHMELMEFILRYMVMHRQIRG